MRIPKFDTMKFLKKLQNGGYTEGGCCIYMPWTQTVGLKVYANKKQRDATHKAQKKAGRLAPATGPAFSVPLVIPERDHDNYRHTLVASEPVYYAYWTQIAEPISDDDFCDDEFTGVDELISEMHEKGFDSGDICSCNCGLVNGRLVCVDWDPLSVS